MSAREQAVETVARAIFLHVMREMFDDEVSPSWAWILEEARGVPEAQTEITSILAEAEAIVDALEAEMGLREEAATHPVFVQREPLEMVPDGIFGMRPARDLLFVDRVRLTTDWQETTP